MGTTQKPVENRQPLMWCLEIRRNKVQVSLCDLRVAEDDGEAHDVASLPKVVCRERVPQAMPADARQAQVVLKHVERSRAIPLLPPRALEPSEKEFTADALSRAELLIATDPPP